ncbi:uncharacterized protein SPSC_06498 [Sporisorium scitamineum]|uniref:Uncharacterized protein n=1 Tax=Sporisorium scitamineum TaxID=49012 RepID=A0A127ZJM4_9BASI|nr:uncharacterized protein SPSC_06498 [Sporisorium scitamineum]
MAYKSSSRQAVLAALSDVVTVSPNPDTDTRSSGFSRHAHHPSYDPDSYYTGLQPLPHSEPPTMVPAKSPFEDPNLPPPPELPPKSANTMASKFANAFRSQTADEKAKRRAKDKRMQDEINKTTAKASRMDIIDRLDLSGINGSSMFHHDSPYDACTPHMNKGKRAPVGAFDPNIDPMTGLPRNAPGARKGASRTTARDQLSSNDSPIDEKRVNANGSRNRSATAPLVPSLSMHAQGSTAELPLDDDQVDADRDTEAERIWPSRQGYHTQPSNVPDSRYDVSNPNADVWGVSAEPWQDFAQPKPAVRSHLGPYSAHAGDRSRISSAASSVLDMEAIMTGNKKPSRGQDELAAGSASPLSEPNWDDRSSAAASSSDAPKRSKSLIKRIRSMRENPNVPPPGDGVEMGSVRDRRRRAAQHKHSPSTPPLRSDYSASAAGAPASSYESRAAAADAAVGAPVNSGSYGRRSGRTVVTPNERDVLTPRANQRGDDSSYFQQQQLSSSHDSRTGRSPGTEGLTRNGSLFNKFRRGQKGSPKSTERPAAYA